MSQKISEVMLTEEVTTFIENFVPYYRLWTTESYERVCCQKTKNVWIGQTYNEAA